MALALKKRSSKSIGKSRGGRSTKIHLVAANDRTAIAFSLSPGQARDAPAGRDLLRKLGEQERPVHLLMDRAYEGNETRQLALDLGFISVVPPLKIRIDLGEYNREVYKRRNEVGRLFRRLSQPKTHDCFRPSSVADHCHQSIFDGSFLRNWPPSREAPGNEYSGEDDVRVCGNRPQH